MKTTTKYLAAALALIAAQSVYAGAANSDKTFAQKGELTRAEVLADLAIWKRAGMDKFWRGNNTPDIYSREYRTAQAEYLRMRSGPEYQQELQRRTQ
ncbi:hypothetical protein A6B37_19185 [Achromobacter sp. HZ01]|uniref:DUF4148 domain-containing protein n=1 Tax=Achromobacter sp. HZ01 TaxID=1416886 RepID=UPI000DC52118|nr:DUF4148 domain-containing protein [Achromobacter sp. HZ01]MBO9328445.1 DUF4148 domain-containing protein [Achromobacter xylosoxidans]RAP62271.1 hypothetical protein A6B37_19185 [Achromobacter sp. HZ01]